jgi:hypothetical protein
MPDIPSSTSMPSGPRAPQSLDYRSPGAAKNKAMSEKVTDTLKTLAWVFPLTILIWIYAEREQSIQRPNVSFPIMVRTSDGNHRITLSEPHDGMVILTLAGPRTAIEKLESDRPTLQITIDPNERQGRGTLDRRMIDLLARNPVFQHNGISVKDVLPANLRVEVDDLETKEVEIRMPDTVRDIVKDAHFEPPTIKVTAPSAVWQAAGANPHVFAKPLEPGLFDQPGQQRDKPVSLEWQNPADRERGVVLSTYSVKASFTVQPKLMKETLPSVPVWVAGPTSFFDKYVVTLNLPGGASTLKDVPIEGSPEQVQALLRPGGGGGGADSVATAVLRVNFRNVVLGVPQHEPAQFYLPLGVKFTGEPQKFEITYTITERTLK